MLKGDHSFQRRQETTLASPIKSSQHPRWWRRNWFYVTLITLAIVGVFCAFFLPPLIPGIKSEGETTDSLRKAILAVLAGSLTMLTLSETHRKNNQEKEKNENDHTRQVYAERRSRYTKAVEQLANEKAAVRLGGIYTLVGLVDDWLADDTLGPEARQKEGQVIINNLCSYIRSPFTLALKAEILESDSEPDNYEGDFSKDQAAFHEEQDVRHTIFVEMSKRSSAFSMNEKGDLIKTIPGIWSDFDFDFTRAPVFYPLNNLTIEKGNFSSAKFYGGANFYKVFFTCDADFSAAIFSGNANFVGANYNGDVHFSEATFTQTADFSEMTFNSDATFSKAYFTFTAYFAEATFTQTADFSKVTFNGEVHFRGADFHGDADFGGAKFLLITDFGDADFYRDANFGGTKFTVITYFRGVTFRGATFYGDAAFYGIPDFHGATFEKKPPKFVVTDEETGITARSQFVTLSEYQITYDFKVSEDSFPILLGEAELEGAKYLIPVGTVLCEPTSWDENKKKYTRFSEPAKPLENSDAEEEKPAE